METGSFGAFILRVLIAPSTCIMKRQRGGLPLHLLSTGGGTDFVDRERSRPEDAVPDHTNSNNEVEKKGAGQR